MREAPRTRQPEAAGAEADLGGDEGAPDGERGDEASESAGLDPLREGPESSVPWGRDRE
jgi:hypothetical protein